MPILENIDAVAVNTSPAPPANEDDSHQTQPTREITQTDHLNKRLLKSLLDSMKSVTDPQNKPSEAESSDGDFDD